LEKRGEIRIDADDDDGFSSTFDLGFSSFYSHQKARIDKTERVPSIQHIGEVQTYATTKGLGPPPKNKIKDKTKGGNNVSATDSSDVGTHPKTFSFKNKIREEKQRIWEFFYL
jgi:hypothetical protein